MSRRGRATSKAPEEEEDRHASMQETSSVHDDSIDFLCECGIAGVVFCVYYATMYRTLAGGDSGDIVSTSCALGVAHPPGYPLQTLLGALFLRVLPWGSPAWRVNMVSVLCGALASGQVFRASCLLLRELQGVPAGIGAGVRPSQADAAACRWAASLGALMFALSPTVWMYSTHAEVFALNNLLVATLVYLALTHSAYISAPSAARRPDDVAVAAAFVIGLGISNQHSFVLSGLPAVFLALVKSQGSLLRPAMLVKLVLAGLAGLTPYSYLVWASRDPSSSSWGEPHSLEGFLWHFLRRDYGTFTVLPGVTNSVGFRRYLWEYARHVWAQTPAGWGLCCIALGLVVCVLPVPDRSGKRQQEKPSRSGVQQGPGVATMGRVCVVLLVVYLAVFHTLCNIPVDSPMHLGVLRRFWMQPHVLASLLLASGAGALVRGVGAWGRAQEGASVLGAVVVLLVAWQIATHFRELDRSRTRYIEDYGRAFLVGMPANATLLVQGDINVHAIRYLQDCEGVRPDILFLDQVLMSFAWYSRQNAKRLAARGIILPRASRNVPDQPHLNPPEGYTWAEFLEVNLPKGEESNHFSFFECGGWATMNDENEGVRGFERNIGPVGLCRTVMRNEEKFDFVKYVDVAVAARRGLDWALPSHADFSKEEWENHISTQVWEKRDKYGKAMLTLWDAFKYRPALVESVREYRSIVATCDIPEMPTWVWKELGTALSYEAGMLQNDGLQKQSTAMQKESLQAFRKYLELTPDAPQGDIIRNHLKVAQAALHKANA